MAPPRVVGGLLARGLEPVSAALSVQRGGRVSGECLAYAEEQRPTVATIRFGCALGDTLHSLRHRNGGVGLDPRQAHRSCERAVKAPSFLLEGLAGEDGIAMGRVCNHDPI